MEYATTSLALALVGAVVSGVAALISQSSERQKYLSDLPANMALSYVGVQIVQVEKIIEKQMSICNGLSISPSRKSELVKLFREEQEIINSIKFPELSVYEKFENYVNPK